MNESEARELNLGTIFHHDPSKKLYTGFEHLKKLLDDNHLTHWVSRYHESPKAWQPFDSDQSIEQLVTQTLSNLNKAGGYAQPLNPSFKDIRTLNDESNRDLLWELRDEGCVVIIDSISMHHPVLQQSFHNSFLDVSPKTAVVTIAPIYNIFDLMRKMTITFQLSISDMEFIKRRYDRHEDFGTCKETHIKREFEHWLWIQVKKMHPPEHSSDLRKHMFNNLAGGRE